jgi:SAM-dependent methyltransferase
MRIRGIGRLKRLLGYDDRNWLRVRQIDAFHEFLNAHSPIGDILEISPGWNEEWRNLTARSYRSVDYPDFDICNDVLSDQFDIVIADQVLEHVANPRSAARNIYAMIRSGGSALVATPFLFRVHARPHDYSRWTAAGLRQLFLEAGVPIDHIQVGSWGNKACVRAHIGGPVRDYGLWRDLANDPEYPIMAWAFVSKG